RRSRSPRPPARREPSGRSSSEDRVATPSGSLPVEQVMQRHRQETRDPGGNEERQDRRVLDHAGEGATPLPFDFGAELAQAFDVVFLGIRAACCREKKVRGEHHDEAPGPGPVLENRGSTPAPGQVAARSLVDWTTRTSAIAATSRRSQPTRSAGGPPLARI